MLLKQNIAQTALNTDQSSKQNATKKSIREHTKFVFPQFFIFQAVLQVQINIDCAVIGFKFVNKMMMVYPLRF